MLIYASLLIIIELVSSTELLRDPFIDIANQTLLASIL
jgi:hypothetical protein